MAKKYINVSGKRKTAIARGVVKKGSGRIRINSKLLDVYEPEMARMKIMEPILIAGDEASKVDIDINVKGGGIMAQAEAARMVIARGLVEWTGSKELKKKFLQYDRHLLVADVRHTEPHKPCRSSARRGKQTSKR